MTTSEVVPAGGGELAIPTGDMTGLEDFDPTQDAVIPRLQIDHNEGVFVDGLTNQKYDTIKVVLLGLIKQRVLWEPEVEENSKGPLCRSFNFTTGNPDLDRFPWKASGFDKTDNQLPCESCALKDWGSHPKRDAPWCSEQHTFPLLQRVDDGWQPSLWTIQRSAIKGSKSYLTAFSRSRTPLYTVFTTLSLDHRKRGTVNFAVPKFIRGEETDKEDWAMFAQNYLQIRQFVQTPRTDAEEEVDVPSTPAPAASAPAAGEDEDLPF